MEAHDGRFHAGWNEAKSDANYSAMVSKRDHPLTPQGVAQARALNDKWRRALSRDFGERPLPFLELDDSGYLGDKSDATCLERVDVVWASPLTRAVQTALVEAEDFAKQLAEAEEAAQYARIAEAQREVAAAEAAAVEVAAAEGHGVPMRRPALATSGTAYVPLEVRQRRLCWPPRENPSS